MQNVAAAPISVILILWSLMSIPYTWLTTTGHYKKYLFKITLQCYVQEIKIIDIPRKTGKFRIDFELNLYHFVLQALIGSYRNIFLITLLCYV